MDSACRCAKQNFVRRFFGAAVAKDVAFSSTGTNLTLSAANGGPYIGGKFETRRCIKQHTYTGNSTARPQQTPKMSANKSQQQQAFADMVSERAVQLLMRALDEKFAELLLEFKGMECRLGVLEKAYVHGESEKEAGSRRKPTGGSSSSAKTKASGAPDWRGSSNSMIYFKQRYAADGEDEWRKAVQAAEETKEAYEAALETVAADPKTQPEEVDAKAFHKAVAAAMWKKFTAAVKSQFKTEFVQIAEAEKSGGGEQLLADS